MDVPKAVDVMKQQQLAEVAELTQEQLDAPHVVVFRETETFMLLDIKSRLVRKDDEESIKTVEASNEAYSAVKELKITAADNYAPRGVNTEPHHENQAGAGAS